MSEWFFISLRTIFSWDLLRCFCDFFLRFSCQNCYRYGYVICSRRKRFSLNFLIFHFTQRPHTHTFHVIRFLYAFYQSSWLIFFSIYARFAPIRRSLNCRSLIMPPRLLFIFAFARVARRTNEIVLNAVSGEPESGPQQIRKQSEKKAGEKTPTSQYSRYKKFLLYIPLYLFLLVWKSSETHEICIC